MQDSRSEHETFSHSQDEGTISFTGPELDFGQFCLAKRTQFAGVSGASGILDGPRRARDRQEIRPFQYSAAFRALAASKIGQSRAEEPRSLRGVSKDGRESMLCGHPSRRIGSADAPQDEGRG